MQEPLISIIIPIYNAELYLEETIDSVLNQTYQIFELLLINHNSTDNSSSIINNFVKKDKRVKAVHLDINMGGPAHPRNVGLDISQGEYVAFLDSDDVWLEKKLEKQLEVFRNSDCDIVHTLANIIDKNSDITGKFQNQRVFNKLKYLLSNKSVIYYTNNININSVLMKTDKQIRFNEDKNLVAMEDWKLWMESIYNGKKVILLEEILLNYRVHTASISNRNSDIGYRKTLYLLSLLLLQREIPLRHYFFSTLFNLIKIIIKNLKRA
ncbi:glycosyltransferase family 2 protein [Sulfurimonas sp.]|jgi:teichuronic acid biosynthesis glycosyltransferase TuaG|uniref:glycosyltransferase family 2 protein n=1 Tax=Sulfurimonas sp. TaxID=2022749 RepID=UPI0025E69135|nr:glycosyltransferase family 2 protein [Sulfurimonas sp.]MBT5935179.1 glycosyltransferase family 2 protein [Sulfurimonas sp.]